MKSETFPPAERSQWWLLLEEPGRSLCDRPCGQSDQDLDPDPSALASVEESDQVVVEGSGHLVVVEALTLTLALAWDLPQGHVGVRSLAAGPHKVVGRSLEVEAAPVEEQSLLLQVVRSSPG